MRVFFTESLFKELSLKAIIVKLKYNFIFIKTKLMQNILFACLCKFLKDRCLVYFCSVYYKISQFIFST